MRNQMSIYREKKSPPRAGVSMGLDIVHAADINTALTASGTFILHMEDLQGNVLHHFEKKNIITLDAGIMAARLFRDPTEPPNGLNMLAVGTGATGAIASPDAPDNRQRKLNSELARKAFSSTTYRDTLGNAVAYPTNIVDFSTTFGSGEAVGALNEMGVMSTFSSNPAVTTPNPNSFPTRDTTVDLTNYDVLVNYLTFGLITKPSGANLTLTWRITF